MVAILSADGVNTRATVPTCKGTSTDTPAGCVVASDVPGGGALKALALPLSKLPAGGGIFRFKMQAVYSNGAPSPWSGVEPAASAAAVTVGPPGAWAPGSVVVQSTSDAGATLQFEPVWLAESYVIEVLDQAGNPVLDSNGNPTTISIPATTVAACAAQPLPPAP